MLVALGQGTTIAVARAAHFALVGMPKVYATTGCSGSVFEEGNAQTVGTFPELCCLQIQTLWRNEVDVK